MLVTALEGSPWNVPKETGYCQSLLTPFNKRKLSSVSGVRDASIQMPLQNKLSLIITTFNLSY